MDIRTVSRRFGAASLILGPLALAIPLTVTDESAPVADQLRDYAGHSGLALTSNLLLFPLMLLVPAMVYAGRLATPKLGFFGGGIAAFGWLCGLIGIGGGGILLYQASQQADQGAAASMVEAVNGDPVYGTLVGVFVLGHLVGMIVLGIGLLRAKMVPTWAAALFTAYPVLHFAGNAVNPIVDTVAGVVLLVGCVVLATRLVRTPGEEPIPYAAAAQHNPA
ncbi:hypothetical protein KOI35_22865 [Actinoplanes bogorensis]|uniref:DUF4386 family protein n=1 Tax=Paractinoplanes bogorensis TaxID=1610840 RepID=A0ABS5YUJ7_9ACTN|nr:hypothetical protein [Actinoplanes bogorensis]MBU2666349.1 hypothetical protein [Actinoplanes bogorensis]